MFLVKGEWLIVHLGAGCVVIDPEWTILYTPASLFTQPLDQLVINNFVYPYINKFDLHFF